MRTILHCDINNCYASIELLHRPALHDKPVVVGGDAERRHGIVLAKNELAKRYKVKTAEPIWEAAQKCPGLVVVPPNFKLYLRFAEMARALYREYTDQIQSFGIDEAWLDVTASASLFGDGEHIANEIRQRFKDELGLTASVGVSWNKIFAKLGSDMKKPDGTTVINQDNVKDTVWPLPVSDLLYVGPATTKLLSRRGIYTIGDLAQTDPRVMRTVLGKRGDMLWSFAAGQDASKVTVMDHHESLVKSIGNSSTCPRDLETDEDVRMMFYVLGESVSARMREGGFVCNTVEIHVRDNELFSFERQGKLKHPTCLAAELVPTAMELFRRHYDWQKPIRSVGIRASDLMPMGSFVQESLFPDEVRLQRLASLEEATDSLRERFGNFALQRAVLLKDRRLTRLDAKHEHSPFAFVHEWSS